jgi:putative acetyltransferase
MNFRNATLEDLPVMKALYRDTILTVCRKDYTEEQTNVWASSANKEERWLDVVVNQYVLLAEIDDVLVGFGTLKDHQYIDFFYVHKDFQGMGIAKEILNRLLQEASSQGTKLITSDISMTAKPFFRKNGFKVVAEQENVRQDQVLINYKMIRYLPGPDMDPEIKSVYAIEDTFNITGRGLVLAGRIVEGNINTFAGDYIEFTAVNRLRRRRIKGVEMFSGPRVGFSKIGLLIQCEDKAEIEELRAWRPFNEIARIYDANANPV